MKKYIKIMSLLSLLILTGCNKDNIKTYHKEVINGGFETASLAGWSIERGDAFNDDSITSRKTFTLDNDPKHQNISINHTGNWYLSGQGYHLKHNHSRTGSIKSNNFILPDNNAYVSFKLAGASTITGRMANSPKKDRTKLCYLSIHLAKNDQMIHYQTNEYFLEHQENYVDVKKYNAGVYNTDNFYEYICDLNEYKGEEVYIRIVDNDTHNYYGYISVDDIRVGSNALPQQEGNYYVKSNEYISDVAAPNKYSIKNGDFETGSLAGWDVISGNAFSHDGVNEEKTWWNECISYSKDGKYHYGHYFPSATGVMRSSEFILGGSGYITYKLGGCKNNALTYLRFMVKNPNGDDLEVARASNFKYWDFQFPYVANGMRLLNMVQYYMDLSPYIGQTMYIEVVDNNASDDELGCITLDSIVTYHEQKPIWYDKESFEFVPGSNIDFEADSIYQVKNGTFETGDLSYWTPSWSEESARIGYVSSESGWWHENFPYNKKGSYLFTGVNDEGNVGSITSTNFTVGGAGYMTFLMGGGRDPLSCYVSVYDASNDVELARYSNYLFNDLGTSLINKGSNLLNMVQYKVDLREYMGKEVYLKVVDNATNSWGLIAVDSFITYYEDESHVPSSAFINENTLNYSEEISEYQVKNGTFETGNLSSWSGDDILNISRDYSWWNECFKFDKQGSYFLNGWVSGEDKVGTLTSSNFTLGGTGYITFRLGGGKNMDLCNIEIFNVTKNEVVAKYANHMFNEMGTSYFYQGKPIDLAKDGIYMANMVLYKADLSSYLGDTLQIRIIDNAVNDWGLMFVDDFITYYDDVNDINSNAVMAINRGA